jgi:Bacteriophage HK97-gp10, putative tail-component
MSTKITIRATGPLHERPKKYLDKACENALSKTARKARNLIMADTPVDTGELRDSWYAKSSLLEFFVSTEKSYAPYVEARFKMLQRNQPLIQKELERQLDIEVPKALNG